MNSPATNSCSGPSLALLAASKAEVSAAAELARQLCLPLLPLKTDPLGCTDHDAVLIVESNTLALQRTRRVSTAAGPASSPGSVPGPVRVDFGSAAMRHRRRSGNNELAGRAVGVGKKRGLHVLDATAGLGRDGFVLADLGCELTLCEREPVIAALLRWGMSAAVAGGDAWLVGVVQRMTLHVLDARCLPAQLMRRVDVIYLDPMFPRRDKSAAIKKEMALFQLLLAAGDKQQEADDLLHWALQQDVARVVVKRPPRSACLAGPRPSHSLRGKAVRYDVYVLGGLASS